MVRQSTCNLEEEPPPPKKKGIIDNEVLKLVVCYWLIEEGNVLNVYFHYHKYSMYTTTSRAQNCNDSLQAKTDDKLLDLVGYFLLCYMNTV